MKLLVIGDRARTEKFLPDLPIVGETELVVVERGTSDEDILRKAADADAILADAISPVSAKLIDGMPNLKMIHSEGVAFNAIDGEAAARRGIYVCNNRGVNAVAVAEQTLLLILGVLKHVVEGDAAVRAGRQIAYKEQLMVSGIEELSGMTVGLIGFGAIAREVAKRLNAFDADVVYTKRHRLDEAEERLLGVRYLGRERARARDSRDARHGRRCVLRPDEAKVLPGEHGARRDRRQRGARAGACERKAERGGA